MELANAHLARMLNEVQERLFSEDKALAREKAVARIRAKLPTPQKQLEDTTTAKELAKKRGKAAKEAAFYPTENDRYSSEEPPPDPDEAAHDPDRRH